MDEREIKSRREFKEWFDGWCDPNIGIIETRIECNAAWAGWQTGRRTTPDREASDES